MEVLSDDVVRTRILTRLRPVDAIRFSLVSKKHHDDAMTFAMTRLDELRRNIDACISQAGTRLMRLLKRAILQLHSSDPTAMTRGTHGYLGNGITAYVRHSSGWVLSVTFMTPGGISFQEFAFCDSTPITAISEARDQGRLHDLMASYEIQPYGTASGVFVRAIVRGAMNAYRAVPTVLPWARIRGL